MIDVAERAHYCINGNCPHDHPCPDCGELSDSCPCEDER